MKRRDFLKTSGAAVAGGLLLGGAPALNSCTAPASGQNDRDWGSTDVLVVGGGPAGVCAAIAAARTGAKVTIIEQGNCLGGMATRGLVAPFMTCYDTTGEVMVIRGLFEEIVDRMVALGGAIHPSQVRAGTPFSAWITTGHDHLTPFDPETLKFVLDQMCSEAGVKILFHTSLVDPILKGSSVTGLRILTREGLGRIGAKVTIDATGDGDVAARAGAPCTFGNPEIGKVQPSTLFFHINNVDTPKLTKDVEAHLHEFRKVNGVSYRALHWRVEEAEAAGEWDIARKSVNIYRGVKEDEWAVNCTRIANVDATSTESLSAAEAEGRRQVQELMNFFHKYVPGCEQATIKSSASTLGIRESRHVQGEYLLTADDLLQGVVPEDSILCASNSVDVHGRNGANTTEYKTVEKGQWYGLPLRSLIPLQIDGLIVAGRAISASSDAAGAVRVMPPCMAMGHAAGIAAALADAKGAAPRNIDPAEVRSILKQQKAFLG
ncbi:MAG: FAD-dependent oxidoreductase [Bacteroidales bacterium]|nr:FAD-dependent oxidoreductase [Bacteroidales bacterium]